MFDPWVTREMTIRDLLVHRSGLGLGAGDLMFVPRTNLTRAESVRRLRYIKPATSFRSGFAYDNVLYMVAGQLIESVTGETWEKFMAEQVLKPAGMLHATADSESRFAAVNRAQPHAHGWRVPRHRPPGNAGRARRAAPQPPPGTCVSANDLARWLSIQLHAGNCPDTPAGCSSAAAHEQMWTDGACAGSAAGARAQGDPAAVQHLRLGWDVISPRHEDRVARRGCSSQTVVVSSRTSTSASMEINCEDGEVMLGLMDELLDHYLGLPYTDWVARWHAEKQRKVGEALEALKAQTAKPAAVGPSLPLERYTGTFADPWYGNIEVSMADGRLMIDFKSTPRMSGTLEHWQYDTFVTHFADKSLEPAYVTFGLGADGGIERVTMKKAPPLPTSARLPGPVVSPVAKALRIFRIANEAYRAATPALEDLCISE
jgi:CubicO group peptidase (beta-lactamase class C family)